MSHACSISNLGWLHFQTHSFSFPKLKFYVTLSQWIFINSPLLVMVTVFLRTLTAILSVWSIKIGSTGTSQMYLSSLSDKIRYEEWPKLQNGWNLEKYPCKEITLWLTSSFPYYFFGNRMRTILFLVGVHIHCHIYSDPLKILFNLIYRITCNQRNFSCCHPHNKAATTHVFLN